MKVMFRLYKGFFILLSILSFSCYAANQDVGSLTLWTRAGGTYANVEAPTKLNPMSFVLDQPVKARLFDVQYQKEQEYRGRFLHEIVERYTPAKPSDTILLHFDNRMIIPMPLELIRKGNIEIFVAIEWKEGNSFTRNFPSIAKPSERWRDPRPLVFQGNKLVVSKPWHPGFGKVKTNGFLPWMSAGSLVGLEWVDAQSYRAQFAFEKTPEVQKGQQVFLERCVYCHAVRKVGGRLGWDFVEPLPIFSKRSNETLHNHVKYEKLDALERGLMMPAQPDFTEDEATSLWKWMRAAAQNPLKNYP
jgi:mono/diheme cytochrome c family protein